MTGEAGFESSSSTGAWSVLAFCVVFGATRRAIEIRLMKNAQLRDEQIWLVVGSLMILATVSLAGALAYTRDVMMTRGVLEEGLSFALASSPAHANVRTRRDARP